ncbi:MAG: V-type ATPase subunit, partial [Lachnospiraceae bacterium]|nr:V-type ATPase subunit [Lachnospiraceae bacterium]
MSVLEGTSFGKYFKEPLNSSDNLDNTYNQVIHKLSSKEFNLAPYSLACVNTYLSEKSKEILRLIKIAESIRYGYRSDVIIAEIM